MKCPPNRAPDIPKRVPANVDSTGFYQYQPIVSVPSQVRNGGYSGIENTEPTRTTQLYCVGTMDAIYRDRNPTLRPISDLMQEWRGDSTYYDEQEPRYAIDPLDPLGLDLHMRLGTGYNNEFAPCVDFNQTPLFISSFD